MHSYNYISHYYVLRSNQGISQKPTRNRATNPNPSRGIDTDHLSAPACILSKGLPFPDAGLWVGRELEVADVAGAAAPVEDLEDTLAEGAAAECELLAVALAFAVMVEVDAPPVAIPLGPMTIGMMMASVLPSSVVVRVKVD